jgi:hypothetical protein
MGNSECLKVLIESKADVQSSDNVHSAAHVASHEGRVCCLQLLIDAKADVNARNQFGDTPTIVACEGGELACLRLLLDANADVDARDKDGNTPIMIACEEDQLECLRVILDANADVNARDNDGFTPALLVCQEDRLMLLQMVVDAKADLGVKSADGVDSVYWAIHFPNDETIHRVPGMPFAVLSCDTDSKNVDIDVEVTHAMVDTHVNEYTQIQAFIDEYHTVTKHALSEDVVVDTRVGRGDYGIYHEPLERTLEYLGLSMKKNQTVNASIDGKSGVKRTLIPGHPVNANLWFELYQRTHCSSCRTQMGRLEGCRCPCLTTHYCNTHCQRQHWQTHKPSHKAVMEQKKKEEKST